MLQVPRRFRVVVVWMDGIALSECGGQIIRRFRLSDAEIQMARELGMNPKKFGSLATEKQQPWKLPLREFIAESYFKRFKRERPEHVRTLEQVIDADDVRRKLLNCSGGTKS